MNEQESKIIRGIDELRRVGLTKELLDKMGLGVKDQVELTYDETQNAIILKQAEEYIDLRDINNWPNLAKAANRLTELNGQSTPRT